MEPVPDSAVDDIEDQSATDVKEETPDEGLFLFVCHFVHVSGNVPGADAPGSRIWNRCVHLAWQTVSS